MDRISVAEPNSLMQAGQAPVIRNQRQHERHVIHYSQQRPARCRRAKSMTQPHIDSLEIHHV
jgi:hypothetical protein